MIGRLLMNHPVPSKLTDPVTAVGVSNPEILSVRNIPIIDLRVH